MTTLVLCTAFLLGSIPFAQILLRRRGLDLRQVGSGNVGAANVLRVSSVRMALAALALDAAKGSLAVWIARELPGSPMLPAWAGLAAIAGHVYPPWLGFRGGKGMATTGGVFLMLTPVAAFGATIAFVAGVAASRYVSFGSLCAMVALPSLTWAQATSREYLWVACAASALVAFRHRSNMRRLLDGSERRLGQKVGA